MNKHDKVLPKEDRTLKRVRRFSFQTKAQAVNREEQYVLLSIT
jgi:hypothetical protein